MRLGGDQRHVAREDHDGRVGVDVGRGRLHRAARAVGLGLDRDLDALGQPILEPALRIVDHDDLPGPGLLGRGYRPQNQRATAQRVQNLGQRGTHARSLAGSDDHDGGRRHRSHRSIEVLRHLRLLMGGGVTAAQRAFGSLRFWVRIQAPQCRFRPARCEHMFVPRYDEDELREVVAACAAISPRCFATSGCVRPAGTSGCSSAGWMPGTSRPSTSIGTPSAGPSDGTALPLAAVLVPRFDLPPRAR